MRASTAGCIGVVAAALTACSSDRSSTTPNAMAIAPDSAFVFVGDSLQLVATNAPGVVAWASSDGTVASVLHGFVHGFKRGQTTISASAGATNASALLTVTLPPTIALATTGIAFEAPAGASTPPAQTLAVANGGDGPLTNIGVGLVTYSPGASGWLTVTAPTNATAPDTVTVQPNTTALAAGTYSATVPVVATAASNSPRSFTVTYTVDAAAVITLSRASVPITAQANGPLPSTQTVAITNSGGGVITGLAPGTTTYSAGATNWLAATLTSANAPSTLTLTVTNTALAVGTYTAMVPVTSSMPGVTPLPVTVTYSVTATVSAPSISLSGASATFAASSGGSVPGSQQIVVTNAGGGTLSGLTAPVTYGPGASGWLSAALGSPTAPATLTLQPTTVLSPGTYTATVAVTSAVANNSPQNVGITYTVTAAPTITLASNTASFLSQQSNVDPPNQTINVSNGGGGTLSGLSASVSYAGVTTGWLSATVAGTAPRSPSSTPLTLQVTTGAIAPGTYTATVTVSSTLSGVTPRSVSVTFERQATLANDVVPQIFSPICAGCHYLNALGVDNVDLSSAGGAYATLVNQPAFAAGGATLVIPGDSTNSYLYQEITAQTTTQNMPLACSVVYGTGCLSAAEVHLVAMWIAQGAAQ